MKLLLAAIVVAPLVLLVVGTIRGCVQVRSCCSVDASKDVRMASAFGTDLTGSARAMLEVPVDDVRAGRAAS
jgi:hypothetical protein